MSSENQQPLFLTTIEKSLLIDGYTKTKFYNKYIPIELCNLIILFFNQFFNFFIIFEKGNDNWNQTNELLCFNIENKQKSTIQNECWKYVDYLSYCVEYNNENNKYNIYRIGGKGKDNNICYEINNNKIIKLPNLLKQRKQCDEENRIFYPYRISFTIVYKWHNE